MANELRLGVTMREVQATGYDEPRDALPRVWGRFLQAAMPEAAWMPIPNLGAAAATRFCDRWRINALILSGGEDIGVSPPRDETERALLRYFADAGQPVLGVCRGLQLMWTELGGEIEAIAGHVGARHGVRLLRQPSMNIDDALVEVNSFHALSLRVPEGSLRDAAIVFARASDGTAEGVRFRKHRMAGIMWHPEREQPTSRADVSLVRCLFGLDEARG